MNTDEYYTIESPAEGIYKEKGSRFLAFVYPVYTQEDIKAILDQIEKKYHDARHRCYAWKLGMTEDNFRANDDGEPSGTAGRPIYGQILSNNLTNVLVVVVRYFGGIKLGTGGLIVAYKTATADAFANANIVMRKVMDTYVVKFSYDAMNDVMKIMKDANLAMQDQQFDLSCSFRVAMRKGIADDVVARLSNIKTVDVEFIGSM